MGIKVDTSEVAKMLKNAAAGLSQEEAGKVAASILREDVKGNFDAGGRPTAWEKPKWRNGSPLVDKGVLRNSIFSGKDSDGKWKVFTSDKRAGTLHYGAKQGAFGRTKRNGPIPRGNIPARPFMVLRDEVFDKIMAALKRRAEGGK